MLSFDPFFDLCQKSFFFCANRRSAMNQSEQWTQFNLMFHHSGKSVNRSIFIDEKSPEIRHSHKFDRHSHFKNMVWTCCLRIGVFFSTSVIYEIFNLSQNENENSAIRTKSGLTNNRNKENFTTWMTPILNQSGWNSKSHHTHSQ